MKLTYEPIEDLNEPLTKSDLYEFYEKIQSLYEYGKEPEKVIQINEKN